MCSTNFGPPQSLNGDNIIRKILVQPYGFPANYWDDTLAAFPPGNWTNERIDAYVLSNKASIRLVIMSTSFDGTTTYTQSSPVYEYSDVSPQIGALTGMPAEGYPTAGGPGNVLTLQASGLSGTLELNVTIGTAPLIAQCPILALDGVTVLDNGAQATAMLTTQSGGTLQNDFMYTIKCQIPPGNGRNLPVLVWRNGLPSGTTAGGGGNTINYMPPAITAAGVFNAITGQYSMRNFPAFRDVRPPTSGVDAVRLVGTNFGGW